MSGAVARVRAEIVKRWGVIDQCHWLQPLQMLMQSQWRDSDSMMINGSKKTFRPNTQSMLSHSAGWVKISVVLSALCIGILLVPPADNPVETYTALITCFVVAVPMIVFGFNRSRRLRRAASVESDVELVLSREGLEYRHPQDSVAIDWSEIINPLDAASHIRRRDGGASLLLIRKDAGQVSRRSLRALRRAHRLGILAPTRVAEGVHIP